LQAFNVAFFDRPFTGGLLTKFSPDISPDFFNVKPELLYICPCFASGDLQTSSAQSFDQSKMLVTTKKCFRHASSISSMFYLNPSFDKGYSKVDIHGWCTNTNRAQ